MIVIDASVIVDAVIGYDLAVARRLAAPDPLHAPVTVDAEVLHALRRRWIAKLLSDTDVDDALDSFGRMPITRHPVQPLVPRMWALRQNVTAYDAAYIALAETLNAPLVTRDARLARSSGHAAAVELIE